MPQMQRLKFTSCMAPNAEQVCQAITRYMGDRLHLNTEFVADIPWQQREYLFDAGEIQVCWICGLPYVWKADRWPATVELLVAPVPQGDRYQGQPIYFSDVVVRQDSPFQSFADLRGSTWAYNEPRSHSGYLLTRAYLARLGETTGYFGRAIESGAHQRSLQMILDGMIDASAIDSTVLETELRLNPSLAAQIRVIDTFGPSPAPPWVVHRTLPPALKAQLRSHFLEMHLDPTGRKILQQGAIARFVAVTNSDYNPIREMAQQARFAPLQQQISA